MMTKGIWACLEITSLLFLLGQPVEADAQALPENGEDMHLGVASCSSSTCHGSVAPLVTTTVLQNEYTVWSENDKHARAYSILLNDESKRIARNLGLESAETADICLDCHADNVPAERRGPKFQLSDGVGCEGCHGGSERWIEVHKVSETREGHQRNLSNGLYPTEDPKARAKLCLSCHLGTEDKLATHRIMGAGHPRLSFELDTFTYIEPAHFAVDEDYIARKNPSNGAKIWAIGQAIAVSETMDAVLAPNHNKNGLFPELFFFDCHACHKPMSANRWQERASLGLGPGVIRFNDSNLIMLRIVAAAVSADLGDKVAKTGRALHQASQRGAQAWSDAAAAMRSVANEAADAFAAHEFGESTMRKVLRGLVREGERGEYIDYVAAEQTTMAISTIGQAMAVGGWLTDAEFDNFEGVVERLYSAVENDERYEPNLHLKALQRVSGGGS